MGGLLDARVVRAGSDAVSSAGSEGALEEIGCSVPVGKPRSATLTPPGLEP
jgi:hypothetical protein